MLRTLELDRALQEGSQQRGTEGEKLLFGPAGLTAFDSAQDEGYFSGFKGIWLAYIELLGSWHP